MRQHLTAQPIRLVRCIEKLQHHKYVAHHPSCFVFAHLSSSVVAVVIFCFFSDFCSRALPFALTLSLPFIYGKNGRGQEWPNFQLNFRKRFCVLLTGAYSCTPPTPTP
jgi:hypothetical protein